MEFRISVSELSRAMSLAQGIVQKSPMPILQNVRLDVDAVGTSGRLTITATDLDVGIRTERACELLGAGSVTVPAKALSDMLRVLPGPDVQLKRLPNNHIEVKSGRTKARLMALSADEYPALPAYHEAEFVDLDATLLTDMVDKTLYAASTEETRYNLNGVLFEPPAATDGPLTFVATDGHRLVRIERQIKGAASLNKKGQVILPRKGLSEIKRILEGSDASDTNIQFGFKDNHAVIKRGKTLLGMRLIDGVFPDYRQVIPKLSDKVVRVSRADLSESLKRVSVLASDRMQPVKLSLSKDTIAVSCNNPDAGEIADDVPVEYSGQSIDVAFNARYLIEALSTIQEQNVVLKLIDNFSPVLVTGVEDTRHLCVVMPMKLN